MGCIAAAVDLLQQLRDLPGDIVMRSSISPKVSHDRTEKVAFQSRQFSVSAAQSEGVYVHTTSIQWVRSRMLDLSGPRHLFASWGPASYDQEQQFE